MKRQVDMIIAYSSVADGFCHYRYVYFITDYLEVDVFTDVRLDCRLVSSFERSKRSVTLFGDVASIIIGRTSFTLEKSSTGTPSSLSTTSFLMSVVSVLTYSWNCGISHCQVWFNIKGLIWCHLEVRETVRDCDVSPRVFHGMTAALLHKV